MKPYMTLILLLILGPPAAALFLHWFVWCLEVLALGH